MGTQPNPPLRKKMAKNLACSLAKHPVYEYAHDDDIHQQRHLLFSSVDPKCYKTRHCE